MADKKISQLTAASTPLAGTEVLPIVQGGSTVKATIANVVGAGTSAGSFTSLTTSATNLLGGATNSGSGIKTQSPSYEVRNSGSDSFQQGVYFGGSTSAANIQAGATASTLDVWVYNGGWQQTCRFVAGNVSVPNGNFVVSTAAKGIDFSANSHAAGMTSELLNWYEEGTWTPALAGSGTAGTYELATASGWYTRVGRSITVIFNVKLAAAVTGGGTGFATLTGLPFATATTNAAAGAVTLGGVNYTAGTNYVTVMPRSVGSSSLIFEEVNINGAVNDMAISAFGVNDTIQGTLTYIV